jgi:tetratricopeptide (TPR) repeat protein
LGLLLSPTDRRSEAEASYHGAIGTRRKLVADFPTNVDYLGELAASYSNLGDLLGGTGNADEAAAAYRDAIAVRRRLVAAFPDQPKYHSDLAFILANLARLCCSQRHPAEARRLLEEALPHHATALRANPRHPNYRQRFRANLLAQAPTLAALGDHATAASRSDEIARLGFDPAIDLYDAACALALCVPYAARDEKLSEAGRTALVEDYAARAVRRLREAAANGYRDAANVLKDTDLDPIRGRADFAAFLGDLAEADPPAAKPVKQ